MKSVLALTLAALAALSTALSAGDAAFDALYRDLPQPAPAAAPAPVPAAQPAVTAQAPAEREWLFLVYINGVNDLGLLGSADKDINEMERVGSTDRVAVVVEYSRMTADPASRNFTFQQGSDTVYINRDEDANRITSRPFFSVPNADMGNANTLVRFVQRAVRKYPARRVALVVWNHGAGHLGIAFDDVSGSHMEVPQLGRALGQIRQGLGRKLDLFATDACLMQMAAVAYEFRDSAEVLVGSQENIPDNGYPYDALLGALAAEPGMDGARLAELLVDTYIASYPSKRVTLSALRAGRAALLPAVLDQWVAAVRSDPEAMKAAASRAVLDKTQRFAMRESRDLLDYLDNVDAALPASPAVKSAAAAVKNFVAHDLILKAAAPNVPKARGLAVYLPEQRFDTAHYSGLAFARDSQWDDFLLEVLEARRKP